MSVPINRITVLNFLILLIFAISSGWLWLRTWYFRLVSNARDLVYDRDGKKVLGATPQMLLGNITEVYSAENQLSAYHSFHQKFGEVVQIFWLWRSQLSVSNYTMAQRILVNNQRNYQKFPPNSIIQQLFGESVLTFANTSSEWKRHRLLLNAIFSKEQVTGFHQIFVDYSEKLVARWQQKIESSGTSIEFDIYSELLALSLDIIGQAAIGKDFSALSGEADEFLNALKYIVYQSTQPAHQFTTWWKYLPLPSNRQLDRAFKTVDEFLARLIRQRQAADRSDSANVLDLLLQATDSLETEVQPLSNKEVRDNLLAIIANGHETVAASIALSLYYLGQAPEKLSRARTEVNRIMARGEEKLTEEGVGKLDYLNCVILETLRFSPPMAGLQRISCDRDLLSGWSIPTEQVIGITLNPLHRNPEYYGERAREFHPERYLESELTTIATASSSEVQSECPIKRFLPSSRQNTFSRTKAGVHLPLTFGDGARKCLAEHFAMYEMKVVLATMLYNFDFQPAANFEAELELGKFGLFLSTFPKHGIKVKLDARTH
jgi:cytochrome P450